jgi:hypothetical protein
MITTILSSDTLRSRQQHVNRLHAGHHSYLPGIFHCLRKLLLLGIFSVLLCESCMAMSASVNDHDQAKKLLDDGIVQPLENILNLYAEQYPGPVMDIKLETKNKLIFYKIDVTDRDGIVQTLIINAQSGQLLQSDPLTLAKKKGFKKNATATN